MEGLKRVPEVTWHAMRETYLEWRIASRPERTTDDAEAANDYYAAERRLLSHFAPRGEVTTGTLFEFARPHFPELTNAGLATALALVAYGPSRAGDPPDRVWQELMQLEERFGVGSGAGSQEVTRCLDIVIAYGCGWERRLPAPVSAKASTWGARWEPAMLNGIAIYLARAVCDLVRSVRYLEEGFPGEQFGAGEAYTQGTILAYQVAATAEPGNGCRCRDFGRGEDAYLRQEEQAGSESGKPLASAGGSRAKTLCDKEEHLLRNWDPQQMSLRSFCISLISGTECGRETSIRLEPVYSGVYYSWIVDAGFLIGETLGKYCYDCNQEEIRRALKQGTMPELGRLEHAFQGARCPNPLCSRVTGKVYRVKRKNWLINPTPREGVTKTYVRSRFRACKGCGHLRPYVTYAMLEAQRHDIESLERARLILMRTDARWSGKFDADAALAWERLIGRECDRLQRMERRHSLPCDICGMKYTDGPGSGEAPRATTVWVYLGEGAVLPIDALLEGNEGEYALDVVDDAVWEPLAEVINQMDQKTLHDLACLLPKRFNRSLGLEQAGCRDADHVSCKQEDEL